MGESAVAPVAVAQGTWTKTMSIYEYSAESLTGEQVPLAKFRGDVLVIVNTASKCGFTPQYQGLESLYQAQRTRGLSVLGFPCNQFGGQEPGTAGDIAAFCSQNYAVTFPMFAKIDVNGSDTHPLYQYLKQQQPGLLGSLAIKWNFTKFLVDREGRVVARHAPTTPPEALSGEIERLLGAPRA
jgi:glutathione peroxidase